MQIGPLTLWPISWNRSHNDSEINDLKFQKFQSAWTKTNYIFSLLYTELNLILNSKIPFILHHTLKDLFESKFRKFNWYMKRFLTLIVLRVSGQSEPCDAKKSACVLTIITLFWYNKYPCCYCFSLERYLKFQFKM